jgi:hypothetical protein
MAGPTDPRLLSYSWTKIRRYWKQRRGPCARCGGAIDYDTPLRIPVGNGRYKLNPAGLHVGHKMARALDKRLVWSVEDTQPEHVRCSTQAGTRLGNALHGKGPRQGQTDRSRQW